MLGIYTLRNIWRTKCGHILGVYLVISSVHECEGTVWDVQLLRHLLYVSGLQLKMSTSEGRCLFHVVVEPTTLQTGFVSQVQQPKTSILCAQSLFKIQQNNDDDDNDDRHHHNNNNNIIIIIIIIIIISGSSIIMLLQPNSE